MNTFSQVQASGLLFSNSRAAYFFNDATLSLHAGADARRVQARAERGVRRLPLPPLLPGLSLHPAHCEGFAPFESGG